MILMTVPGLLICNSYELGLGSYGGNDYFAFDNFNPGATNYNSNAKMIYNIKP